LTKMEQENLDFSVALKQAQDLGYAESDPTFDIKGIDTAHKLALLAAIADGTKPAFSELSIEGVDEVSIEDINLAKELGYKIKILAVYKKFAGFSQQAVYPALVNKSEKIAQVDDSFNAILTKASNADWNFVVGRGAGGFPTASAVVADLIDIANDRYSYAFGVKTEDLKDANIHKISDRVGGYFLKLVVNKDLAQKTNLAEVIFGDKIKIKKSVFIDKDEEILCGFLTENHKEQDILDALKTLDSSLVKSSKFLRVEEIVGF
jgi:homoserine dehydrogenase